jgi:hypothetical protein
LHEIFFAAQTFFSRKAAKPQRKRKESQEYSAIRFVGMTSESGLSRSILKPVNFAAR